MTGFRIARTSVWIILAVYAERGKRLEGGGVYGLVAASW
jgi:hypothetical protein